MTREQAIEMLSLCRNGDDMRWTVWLILHEGLLTEDEVRACIERAREKIKNEGNEK